jgi:hypothetical protein
MAGAEREEDSARKTGMRRLVVLTTLTAGAMRQSRNEYTRNGSLLDESGYDLQVSRTESSRCAVIPPSRTARATGAGMQAARSLT